MEHAQTLALDTDSEPPSCSDWNQPSRPSACLEPRSNKAFTPHLLNQLDTDMELLHDGAAAEPMATGTHFGHGSALNPAAPWPVMSERSAEFLRQYFPYSTAAQWLDWRWQLKHSITRADDLARFIELSHDERQALCQAEATLPLRITPYYLSLVDTFNPEQAIRRTVVPVAAEMMVSRGESIDPLGEEDDSPVPGLVHRYPDRVLFLVTGFCSTYCRYCTRSRMVGDHGKGFIGGDRWEKALQYISQHREVRDVLLSGGDPLTMPDAALEYLLKRLRAIDHVEFVRLGTKVPVVLPQRITHALVTMLARYHPLWMNVHFTHPDEITAESREACTRLANAGIPLGSQTVLLKGINDEVEQLKRLYHELLKIRVRPYYLYQCDPIAGSSHFRTSVQQGLKMIEGLRGHTTGLAVPHYVIDAPGGGGKIPLLPDYHLGHDDTDVVLRNYAGALFRYPDLTSM